MKLITIVLGMVVVVGAAAQALVQNPKFDVASIKLHTTVSPGIVIDNEPGGRFVATNATARMLLSYAFPSLQDYQIIADEGWFTSDRFDVEARIDRTLTSDEAASAVRSLLEDRFQLKSHTEMREMSRYSLRVAKDGVKLHRVQSPASSAIPQAPSTPSANAATIPRGGSFLGPGIIEAPAITMPRLVKLLSAMACRPVFDHTGIPEGDYEVHLHFTPEPCPGNARVFGAIPVNARSQGLPDVDDGATLDSSRLSIFTALQEQLGLKLESSKGPVEVLVIDSVSRPSEN
jgi:uncharacterized protein (TIGR03435 family)